MREGKGEASSFVFHKGEGDLFFLFFLGPNALVLSVLRVGGIDRGRRGRGGRGRGTRGEEGTLGSKREESKKKHELLI